MAENSGRLSRRGFLALGGVGLVGAAVLGTAVADALDLDASNADGPLPGADWLFGRYDDGCTDADFDESDLSPVTLPHTVANLSWTGWDPASWQDRWVYRRRFTVSPAMRAGRAWVRFEGILTCAAVYLNGTLVATHDGGYLPFEVALDNPVDGENVLAVAVDGRWQLDVPPNLPRSSGPTAIDFYQPAGIYRPATVFAGARTRISDVFARPVNVLTDDRYLDLTCELDALTATPTMVQLTATVTQDGKVLGTSSTEIARVPAGRSTVHFEVHQLGPVRLWDVADPALCEVTVVVQDGTRRLDSRQVRIGFREASFTADGFFLNGRRLKLFGLNRHQWFPFAGGAMPDRVQRRDAEILRHDLNCNIVRCSHYPQSPAFLDACDELGLLVWEEIPGWGHVGDNPWQQQNLHDVSDMIIRDRNHPSVVVWGTRVNEAVGTTAMYLRTGRLARGLDPSRPTSGALASATGYHLALPPGTDEEVLAYNDYTARRGAPFQLRPPRQGVPYLVTETIGSLAGPKAYRRTDQPAPQELQAELHAKAHDLAAADDHYCGLLAWCAFDYPSGWSRSINGSKFAGVSDIFRIPKVAAAFYRAQGDPATRPVVEPAFAWDFGAGRPPGGPGGNATVWSNCDRLAVFVGNKPVGDARSRRAEFPHLAHAPFAVNLNVPKGTKPDLRIDGYVGDTMVLSRRFSGDRAHDVLSCVADDPVFTADGSDATRVVVAATDRYGTIRAYTGGTVSLSLDGPGTLVGDGSIDFAATGGAFAVWLRGSPGSPGLLTLTAQHPALGNGTVRVTTRAPGAPNPQP